MADVFKKAMLRKSNDMEGSVMFTIKFQLAMQSVGFGGKSMTAIMWSVKPHGPFIIWANNLDDDSGGRSGLNQISPQRYQRHLHPVHSGVKKISGNQIFVWVVFLDPSLPPQAWASSSTKCQTNESLRKTPPTTGPMMHPAPHASGNKLNAWGRGEGLI